MAANFGTTDRYFGAGLGLDDDTRDALKSGLTEPAARTGQLVQPDHSTDPAVDLTS